ncbi:15861_t:CDS:2, partial [Racocetra persica]
VYTPNFTSISYVLVDYESDESEEPFDCSKTTTEFILFNCKDSNTVVDNKHNRLNMSKHAFPNQDYVNIMIDDKFDGLDELSNLNAIVDSDTDESDKPSDFLKLTSRCMFPNWDEFKNWIHQFVLKKGFNYKTRTNEIVQGIMRRATYEYTKSRSYNPHVTSDPTKRRNTYS